MLYDDLIDPCYFRYVYIVLNWWKTLVMQTPYFEMDYLF